MGAFVLFAALGLVTRALSAVEFDFWPIVLALIGAFILILARPDIRVPMMSRSAALKTLALFALLWASFAIKWDRELDVRFTVHEIFADSSGNLDRAYARWKSADMESRYRIRRTNAPLSEQFDQREEREERAAAAAAHAKKQATEAAKRAEDKRRREAWEKNPLRYPVAAIELILVLISLSMSGNPGH